MPKVPKKIAKMLMPMGQQCAFPIRLKFVTDAPAEYYRVLFWIAYDPELIRDMAELALCAECSVQEADDAIHYWTDHKIIEIIDDWIYEDPEDTEFIKDEDEDSEPIAPYSAEMAMFLQGRQDIQELVEIVGQICNVELKEKDISILIDMIDYLNLTTDYIVHLIRHCLSIEIAKFEGFKKYAIRLNQDDVTTIDELLPYLQREQEIYRFVNKIKVMFNSSYRALTAREKKMIENWYSYGYKLDAIKKAYDITLQSTEKPLIEYADKIIERWHGLGAKNLEEIELSYKLGATKFLEWKQKNANSSFDTDDFFEAALRHSFQSMGIDEFDSDLS